jgi:hypothetical protein
MKFSPELKILLLVVHSLGQGAKKKDFFPNSDFLDKNYRLKSIKIFTPYSGESIYSMHNDGIALN